MYTRFLDEYQLHPTGHLRLSGVSTSCVAALAMPSQQQHELPLSLHLHLERPVCVAYFSGSSHHSVLNEKCTNLDSSNRLTCAVCSEYKRSSSYIKWILNWASIRWMYYEHNHAHIIEHATGFALGGPESAFSRYFVLSLIRHQNHCFYTFKHAGQTAAHWLSEFQRVLTVRSKLKLGQLTLQSPNIRVTDVKKSYHPNRHLLTRSKWATAFRRLDGTTHPQVQTTGGGVGSWESVCNRRSIIDATHSTKRQSYLTEHLTTADCLCVVICGARHQTSMIQKVWQAIKYLFIHCKMNV
jgi:hypothetical protein